MKGHRNIDLCTTAGTNGSPCTAVKKQQHRDMVQKATAIVDEAAFGTERKEIGGEKRHRDEKLGKEAGIVEEAAYRKERKDIGAEKRYRDEKL